MEIDDRSVFASLANLDDLRELPPASNDWPMRTSPAPT